MFQFNIKERVRVSVRYRDMSPFPTSPVVVFGGNFVGATKGRGIGWEYNGANGALKAAL